MALSLRIDRPGAWHHVMHRGARREPIFRGDEHCLLGVAKQIPDEEVRATVTSALRTFLRAYRA